MKTKTASDLLFNLGQNAAMEVFGAPYHYLSWNQRLACKTLAAIEYTVIVARITLKR
jgi:hypothetical protein